MDLIGPDLARKAHKRDEQHGSDECGWLRRDPVAQEADGQDGHGEESEEAEGSWLLLICREGAVSEILAPKTAQNAKNMLRFASFSDSQRSQNHETPGNTGDFVYSGEYSGCCKVPTTD
jgi:hypothetical protein